MTASRRGCLVRIAALAATIALGLATRKAPGLFPAFIATYGGDTLYATLWVQLFGGLAALLPPSRGGPRRSVTQIAVEGFGVSAAVEFSQRFHPAWLDAIRATTLGGLVLGHGFLWSDMVCYAVGAVIGGGLERALRAVSTSPAAR